MRKLWILIGEVVFLVLWGAVLMSQAQALKPSDVSRLLQPAELYRGEIVNVLVGWQAQATQREIASATAACAVELKDSKASIAELQARVLELKAQKFAMSIAFLVLLGCFIGAQTGFIWLLSRRTLNRRKS